MDKRASDALRSMIVPHPNASDSEAVQIISIALIVALVALAARIASVW
jgi:hypothetical protein